jgi:hypothetical protein
MWRILARRLRSAASPVRRQRERVVLLAIRPATKMSAKSFAGNSGPMAVRISVRRGSWGGYRGAMWLYLLREVKRDYLSQYR